MPRVLSAVALLLPCSLGPCWVIAMASGWARAACIGPLPNHRPTRWWAWQLCWPAVPGHRSRALLLLFELTHDIRIVLPLMAATGLSALLMERWVRSG